MADLLKYIEQEKQKKLKQFESELQAETTKLLSPLEETAATLEAELVKKTRTLREQLVSQKEYELSTSQRFAALEARRKGVKMLWDKTTTSYFAKSDNVQNWLAGELKALPEGKAEVAAGPSEPVLHKLLSQYPHLTLKADKSIEEPGFVYRSEHTSRDVRLSSYLADKYRQIEVELNRLLFGYNE